MNQVLDRTSFAPADAAKSDFAKFILARFTAEFLPPLAAASNATSGWSTTAFFSSTLPRTGWQITYSSVIFGAAQSQAVYGAIFEGRAYEETGIMRRSLSSSAPLPTYLTPFSYALPEICHAATSELWWHELFTFDAVMVNEGDEDVESVADDVVSDAVSMTDDLKSFLAIADASLGKIIGVGRTTLVSWRRSRHEARPSTIARILQFHALVSGLRNALGDAAARAWFYEDDRLKKLTSETAEEVLEKANRIIFRDAPRTWEASYRADTPTASRD